MHYWSCTLLLRSYVFIPVNISKTIHQVSINNPISDNGELLILLSNNVIVINMGSYFMLYKLEETFQFSLHLKRVSGQPYPESYGAFI
jgi:hypothetical protein